MTTEQHRKQLYTLRQEAYNLLEQARLGGSGQLSQEKRQTSLSDYLKKAASLITEIFTSSDTGIELLDERAFKKDFGVVNYIDLRRAKVAVPRGLQVPFIDHLNDLHQIYEEGVSRISEEALEPLQRLISRMLSEPDELNSARYSRELENINRLDIEKISEPLADNFSVDGAEFRPYESMVYRQSDWVEIAEKFNDLVERAQKHSVHQMRRDVENIAELIEVLVEKLENDPDTYTLSSEQLQQLSIATYTAAELVELAGNFHYLLQELGSVLKYNRERLVERLKAS